jgi:hypothetical protein
MLDLMSEVCMYLILMISLPFAGKKVNHNHFLVLEFGGDVAHQSCGNHPKQ